MNIIIGIAGTVTTVGLLNWGWIVMDDERQHTTTRRVRALERMTRR